MQTENSKSLRIKTLTWTLRIICGGLFIFSGFTKAVDPWGTIFKVSEYLAALDFDIPFSLVRLGVFFLCAFEFIVGCFLALGCFRKSCPVFAALIMCFMLPLSLWIAVMNPVSDCGCFGDAWHISNWATFIKNVVLSGGIVWLIFRNLVCPCLITPAFQWLAVLASGIFVLVIELIGYVYQPLIDFRDYPVGSYLFADPYADLQENNEEIDEKLIDVFDVKTGDDLTHEVFDRQGKELIVMIPKVSVVSPATTWKLNSLYEWSEENNVKMIGIVAGSPEEIDRWEDLSMASYPIYLADDTTIEEIVRGNPGIVYLDKGKIIWKSSLSAIDVDDFLSPEVGGDASAFGRDNTAILRNISLIYLIAIGFLVLISFTPKLAHLLIRGGFASKKGVRHH